MWRTLTATLITLFWIAMMALLIASELLPDTPFLRIPTEVVAREIFAHDQTSILTILDGERRLGTIMLQPRLRHGPEGRIHHLRITGSSALPGHDDSTRVAWDATLQLDARFDLRRLELDLESRRPTFHLRLGSDTREDRHTVAFSEGGSAPTTFEGSAEQILRQIFGFPELRALAPDPRPLIDAARQQIPKINVRAARSRLAVDGRKMETYRITVTEGGTLQSEIHMTPLGQILTARTPIGLRLVAEDLESLSL